ncbi:MAG: hypothetical protein KJ749_13995 [Planctomycetes bacterium]|nr:hypothetical protein [Planctomycetota bacterium]
MSSGASCPGGNVELELSAGCEPDCASLDWSISSGSPDVTPNPASGSLACPGGTVAITVEVSSDAAPGPVILSVTGTTTPAGGSCNGQGTVSVAELVNLTFAGLPPAEETDPGGFLAINDDDDNENGVPDMNETGVDPDVRSLELYAHAGLTGTATLSPLSGAARVKAYSDGNRTTVVPLPKSWDVGELPQTLYLEGVQVSSAVGDVELRLLYAGDSGPCEDRVKLTVLRAEIEPITSGIGPIPINPAIVAPMTPLLLDDGVLFWNANYFALTTFQPNVDLSTLPVTWVFDTTSGFLNPTAEVVAAPDRRSARLEIPWPSFGNLGTGRMEFHIGEGVYADIEALIKNVQPDLEPGDFRFQIKAHLCTDGAGTSTSRTEAEIRTIMSDVTKVLSQCGIIVTTGQVVTTQVNPAYMKLDSTAWFDMWFLFGTDEDATAIDVFFIQAIDFAQEEGCGYTSGLTGTPAASGVGYEAGIAIPDSACDGTSAGQEVVRTLAHEIVHYLFNHNDVSDDHVADSRNLMLAGTNETKRDLSQTQCLEVRSNYGVD